MKLVYWVASCLNDSPMYSIRERTRKACKSRLNEFNPADAANYGKPHKVVVEYDSAFDLLVQCLSEGGIYEDRDETTYHQNEDKE